MAQMPGSLDAVSWGLLLLLSVLWGGAFFLAGIAVDALPPLTVAFARVAMAASMLLPVFWLCGHRLPMGWRGWRPFIGMGVLNNVLPFSLIFAGQVQISAGLASIINGLTPLFTVVVMAGFGEERLTLLRLAGVLLGVVGIAVLHGLDAGMAGGKTLGIGLCVAATLSYAFAALWGRRHLAGRPPLVSATCQLIGSSVVMLAVAGLVDRPWTLAVPAPRIWLALVGLALFGTAIAYIVFFRILVRAGAGNVMLVTLLIPVTALMLDYLFLGEPIRLRELAGAGIIAAGLLFIDGRLFRDGRLIRFVQRRVDGQDLVDRPPV